MLVNHFVEYWFNSFLGKCWISHTDDGLEVWASEDSGLFLNISEFLGSDMNLSRTGGTITSADSNIISHEMSGKSTWSKLNHSSLRQFLGSRGGLVVVREFFLSVSWKLDFRVEDPCVSGTGIKESSKFLWRVANVYLWDIGVVLEVDLSDVSLNWLSRLVNWAVGDLIDFSINLGMLLLIALFVLAVGQLNICNIKGLWFTVFSGFIENDSSVALSLR